MRRAFAFYVVANATFCIRTISAYLANTRATRIQIKVEPSFTQRIRVLLASQKMPIVDCQSGD